MTQQEQYLQRLRRISAVMRAATVCAMVLTPIAFAAVILADGFAIMLQVPRDIAINLSGQPFGVLIAAGGLAAVEPVMFLLALWLLQDLFRLYGHGVVFEARDICRLRHLGWALIGIDLADFLQRLASGPVLSWLGITEPFFSVGFGLSLSIVGVLVIVIARVMDIGRDLKTFAKLTI